MRSRTRDVELFGVWVCEHVRRRELWLKLLLWHFAAMKDYNIFIFFTFFMYIEKFLHLLFSFVLVTFIIIIIIFLVRRRTHTPHVELYTTTTTSQQQHRCRCTHTRTTPTTTTTTTQPKKYSSRKNASLLIFFGCTKSGKTNAFPPIKCKRLHLGLR